MFSEDFNERKCILPNSFHFDIEHKEYSICKGAVVKYHLMVVTICFVCVRESESVECTKTIIVMDCISSFGSAGWSLAGHRHRLAIPRACVNSPEAEPPSPQVKPHASSPGCSCSRVKIDG